MIIVGYKQSGWELKPIILNQNQSDFYIFVSVTLLGKLVKKIDLQNHKSVITFVYLYHLNYENVPIKFFSAPSTESWVTCARPTKARTRYNSAWVRYPGTVLFARDQMYPSVSVDRPLDMRRGESRGVSQSPPAFCTPVHTLSQRGCAPPVSQPGISYTNKKVQGLTETITL